MDAAKLRSALTDIDEVANNPTVEHEDLEYFFKEVLVMAKENMAEVETVIGKLKAIDS